MTLTLLPQPRVTAAAAAAAATELLSPAGTHPRHLGGPRASPPPNSHPVPACLHNPGYLQLHQRLAFRAISTIRRAFDIATGYHPDRMDEAQWLRRIIFLETVAGVPGMVSVTA